MKSFHYILLAFLLLAATVPSCKKEGVISASTDILEVDYPGEDFTINIQATSHWTVVANYAPPTQAEMMNHKDPVWYNPSGAYSVETGWISPEITEGEGGDTRLTVHIKATTGKSRYGSLIFKLTEAGKMYTGYILTGTSGTYLSISPVTWSTSRTWRNFIVRTAALPPSMSRCRN